MVAPGTPPDSESKATKDGKRRRVGRFTADEMRNLAEGKLQGWGWTYILTHWSFQEGRSSTDLSVRSQTFPVLESLNQLLLAFCYTYNDWPLPCLETLRLLKLQLLLA